MAYHEKITEKQVNSSIRHLLNCMETDMAVAFKELTRSMPQHTGQDGTRNTRGSQLPVSLEGITQRDKDSVLGAGKDKGRC